MGVGQVNCMCVSEHVSGGTFVEVSVSSLLRSCDSVQVYLDLLLKYISLCLVMCWYHAHFFYNNSVLENTMERKPVNTQQDLPILGPI